MNPVGYNFGSCQDSRDWMRPGHGTLHHVIGRGIEGSKIFRDQGDRKDFRGDPVIVSVEGEPERLPFTF